MSEGTEERHGLMSSGIRGMSSPQRKLRHWQKVLRLKLGRHMFWGLMVLVFMCVIAKFVLLNMFSEQLDFDPINRTNVVKHLPSPTKSPVYNILFHLLFYSDCNYIQI